MAGSTRNGWQYRWQYRWQYSPSNDRRLLPPLLARRGTTSGPLNNITVQLPWARHGGLQSAPENRRFRGLVGHGRRCKAISQSFRGPDTAAFNRRPKTAGFAVLSATGGDVKPFRRHTTSSPVTPFMVGRSATLVSPSSSASALQPPGQCRSQRNAGSEAGATPGTTSRRHGHRCRGCTVLELPHRRMIRRGWPAAAYLRVPSGMPESTATSRAYRLRRRRSFRLPTAIFRDPEEDKTPGDSNCARQPLASWAP